MAVQNSDDPSFLAFMARHFVAYVVEYESLNADGSLHHRGHAAISGFVMQLHDHWFWVTAGHCLRNLNQLRILNGAFVDSFGWEARDFTRVPFTYSEDCAFSVYDKKDGLDFGLVVLDSNKVKLFRANGVVPITRENWIRQAGLTFELYKVLGLPLLDSDDRQLVMANVQRIEVAEIDASNLDELPSDAFFLGRLDPEVSMPTMEGMSGGPIYGFRRDAEGQWSYHVVALQSSWIKSQRVLYGCSVPLFAEQVYDALATYLPRD